MCNAVNPRRIVLGGSLAQAGDLVLDGVRRGLQTTSVPINADVEVVRGQLGRDASALGAIALVLGQREVTDLSARG